MASKNVDIGGYTVPSSVSGSQGYINTVDNSGSTNTQNNSSSRTGSTSSNTRDVMHTTNIDAASLAALRALIGALQSGGTQEQRVSSAKRDQIISLTEQLLAQVSPDQAFTDAKGLMALTTQQNLEKNMPAIQRSIEGAGTSASSQQGLLAQQLARDSSLASAALGAEQAKSYANNRVGFANTLEALTRPNNEVTNSLINALQIAKGAVVDTVRNTSSNTTSLESGTSTQTSTTGPSSSTTTHTPTDSTGGSSSSSVPSYQDFGTYSGFGNLSSTPAGLPANVVRTGNTYSFAKPNFSDASEYQSDNTNANWINDIFPSIKGLK